MTSERPSTKQSEDKGYLIGKIPMKNPASFPVNTLLIKSGAFFTAFVYVVASAGLGILAVMAGQCAVK